MSTGAPTQWIDQRLDALDRALLGLVPRQERIDLVAGIESKLRAAGESKPPADEAAASPPEEISFLLATDRRSSRPLRKRSRLALSSGILGIIAMGLLILFPLTYVLVATSAGMIGEIPAIALLVFNVLAVAGAGTVSGLMALLAIVRLSKSSSKKRGFGWAITGLCTAPTPMLCGLLAIVFFVLPMVIQYANEANRSPVNHVAWAPNSPECELGLCPPPLPSGGNVTPVASLPPASLPSAYGPAPVDPSFTTPPLETADSPAEVKKPTRVKHELSEPAEGSRVPPAVEPTTSPSPESDPPGAYAAESPPSFQAADLMLP